MSLQPQRPLRPRSDLASTRTPERRRRLAEVRNDETETALRFGPDGLQEVVPVTREILLNPSFDVQILQNPPHDEALRWIAERLDGFLHARNLKLHCDVGLDWPGERRVSPDLSVIEDLPAPPPGTPRDGTIQLGGDSPARVRAVFEVVSAGKASREKDEVDNPPLFARHGVDECVLVYLPELRKPTDPPFRVLADPTPTGYATQRQPDRKGFVTVRSLGIRIGVELTADGQERVVAYDLRTGERLRNAAEEAEARRQEAEARRQEAEARQAAEERAEKESEARRQAEQRTAESVVLILEARGLEITDAQRRRILDCQDPETIRRWIVGAVTVDSIDDLR